MQTSALERRWLMVPVILVVVTVGMTSVVSFSIVGVLAAAVFLGTVALAPRLNPLVYWPVGLLVTITVGYVSYLAYWFAGMQGLDEGFARMHFVLLLAVGGLVALFRVWRTGGSAGRFSFSLSGMIAASLSLAFPLVLLWIGTSRLWSGSMSLFSGFMAGGDHGLHNEIVHDLLSWSSTPSLENPFTLYTYPRGIHFLVASLVALGSGKSGQSSLVQEYMTFAWFEYVQLAAYVQLAVAILVFWSRERRATRAIFVAPILLIFASMPHFVAHLFWSGFTTSTGMTWALLVPVALWVARREQELGNRHRIEALVVWVLLLVFSWIVYQPYVIAISTTGLALVCSSVWTTLVHNGRLRRGLPESLALPACFVVSFIGATLPYFVLGKDSAAVNFLFLDGSTWRVGVATVTMWTAAAVMLPRMMAADGRPQTYLPSAIVAGLLGFTVGMAGLVFVTGDHGLFDLPYYIQKMYWVMLFISVPVALGSGLTMLLGHRYLGEGRQRFGRQLALWLLIALVPLVQGRTPNAAVTHIGVDWFARAVVRDPSVDITRSVAFYPADRLGSHLANLALKAQSNTQFPIGMSLAGNAHLGCRFVNREPVEVVFTGAHGLSLLAEAGCRLDRKYVVDGQLVDVPPTPYTDIVLDTEYRVGNADIGQFLLFRGVKGVKQWGAELTGYLSAIGIQVPAGARDVSVELSYRPSDTGPSEPAVTFGIGGRPVVTAPLHGFHWRTVRVPLVGVKPGEKLEVTVDCAWSDEEAGTLVEGRKPDACLDLRTVRVVSGPMVDQQDQDPPTRVTPSS